MILLASSSADLISCRYKVIFLERFNDESVATFVLIGRIERSSFSLLVKMSHRFVNHEAFFREIHCILTRDYR